MATERTPRHRRAMDSSFVTNPGQLRSLSGGEPPRVEVDLLVDQPERSREVGQPCLDPLAVRPENLPPLRQGSAALADERRVFPHLADRHSGTAETVQQLQPPEVLDVVHPPATAITDDTGNK